MSTDIAHLAHTDMIRRIYLNGGRMITGTPGDGNPLTPYRLRFVGHIIAGSRGK